MLRSMLQHLQMFSAPTGPAQPAPEPTRSIAAGRGTADPETYPALSRDLSVPYGTS